MEESMLLPIVRRLNAMRFDTSGKRQLRMFEQFGIPVCEVTYVRESDEFIFVRFRPQERFCFDSIDLTAIEVYDSLYELRHTF